MKHLFIQFEILTEWQQPDRWPLANVQFIFCFKKIVSLL